MKLTAQEIDWVLYSINKTINDNGGMWDNTLTNSIKSKLNNELLLKTEDNSIKKCKGCDMAMCLEGKIDDDIPLCHACYQDNELRTKYTKTGDN